MPLQLAVHGRNDLADGLGSAGGVGDGVDGGSAQVVSVESLLPEVEKLVASGMRLKDACKHVTEGTGVSNRDLYQAALQKP